MVFILTFLSLVLEESPGERDGHCIIKTTTYIATKTKDQYISPDCEVLKMNTEGVIALSGDFITGGDETPPGPNG